MKSLFRILLISILSMGMNVYGQQKAMTFKTFAAIEMQYLLYLPKDYNQNTAKTFPLLLFLHGGGESGNEIEMVKKHGPPMLVEAGKEFPFLILSPQNPNNNQFWDEHVVKQLLDSVLKVYRVDSNRVYLSGLSRGAYGAWRLAIQHPKSFAALIAISGGSHTPYANWLGDLPIWVFHGIDDQSIPVEESDRMVEALRKNGNKVRYTRYPDSGHDAWTNAFNTPELWEWLFKQKKQKGD